MAAGAQTLTRSRAPVRPYRPMATVQGDEQADPASQVASANAPYDPNGGMQDTSGFNLYGESAGRTPLSTLAPASVPFYDGTDLAKQYQNNRNTQQNEGDRLEGYFGGESSRRSGLENAALLKSGQLQTELERTPGYTSQEAGDITRGEDYKKLLGTDYDSNFLTPEERAAAIGDPHAASAAFDPSILRNTNETAFNANSGNVSGTRDKLSQGLATMKSEMGDAVDPSKLGLSRGYQAGSDAVLNATGDRVWDAATSEGLDMSGEYGRQAGMTDQEVSDTAAMGGQAVGARSRSAIQDLERQAAASGNSNPLAVAAARREFEDQNAVQSADATVNAQLAARDAQRKAATGVEGTRLSSEQYKTGAQIGAGMDLGRFAQGALDTREGMRLGSEQDISSRRLGVASQVGQAGRDDARWAGERQIQNENDWADRAHDAGKFDQNAAYSAAAAAEREAADRAMAVATNRQGTNQTNQNNQFNRGYQVNATLSGGAATVADARRQGQQENRNYYQGQQQYQGAQGAQQQQNLLTNRAQTQQGVDKATEGSAGWELGNKQSGNWFTKNVIPLVNTAAKFKPGA